MLNVHTAQYRYNGADRLDITVKGKDPVGGVFAPTWEIVMGVKRGSISEQQYTEIYYSLMGASWRKNKEIWRKVWNMSEVTLVCFCPKGAFCHRNILANMLKEMGANYIGER